LSTVDAISPVPLSNRSELSSHYETDRCLVGVDRLALGFAVGAFDPRSNSWSTLQVAFPGGHREVHRRKTSERVGGAEVFLTVSEVIATHQMRGNVEFNPARALYPDEWGLVPPKDVRDALRLVLPVLRKYMTPTTDLENWRLGRVDLARDFQGVKHGPDLLRGLTSVPRAWARINSMYFDKHGAQTIMVGSGAGLVRL
jgi:hypothetical protein